jgi:hypothetical protein
MQSDQWQLLHTCPDQTALQIASTVLQQIEIFIQPDQPIAGLDLGGLSYVRPNLHAHVQQVLSQAAVSDAELDALALSSPAPKDV